jgi:hypothetical protein
VISRPKEIFRTTLMAIAKDMLIPAKLISDVKIPTGTWDVI